MHRDTKAIVCSATDISANNRDKFAEIYAAVAIFVKLRDKFFKLRIAQVYVVMRECVAEFGFSHRMVASKIKTSKGGAVMLEISDELGDEDRALDAWGSLAERVNSIPRRRYVEDRLMTVASRLGKLADIAVDLVGFSLCVTAQPRY